LGVFSSLQARLAKVLPYALVKVGIFKNIFFRWSVHEVRADPHNLSRFRVCVLTLV